MNPAIILKELLYTYALWIVFHVSRMTFTCEISFSIDAVCMTLVTRAGTHFTFIHICKIQRVSRVSPTPFPCTCTQHLDHETHFLMRCWKAGKRLGTTLTCALLPISCVSRSAVTVVASTSIDAERIRTIAWITTITLIDICSKLTTKPINYNIYVSGVL